MSGGPGLQKPDPAEHKPDQSGGDRSVNVDGDNYGIVSTGDNANNVLIFPAARPAENSLAGKANLLADRVSDLLKREEEQQRLWDPAPLPVHCRPAPATLTGRRNSILDVPAEAAAALPLDLTGPLEEIAAVYEGTKPGRLMVLGRAGSGKTHPDPAFRKGPAGSSHSDPAEAPVPVIFSLGSWNPTTTPLRDWLIEPAWSGTTPFWPGASPDGSTWAAALVGADHVLAILDGFDEIADGLHETAR